MPYLLQVQISGDIPASVMREALDDDGDNVQDEGLWEVVLGSVETEINGILGQRYTVPFLPPIPAIIINAARVLVLEKLYQRRNIAADQNPWTSQASSIRSQLKAIAAGEQLLTPETKKILPTGFVLTEPSGTYLSGGGQLA